MIYHPAKVKVWGPYACFTRPEAKIERVSYEVMTPSAARGILEAIFWHPPMQWRIQKIYVLNPIRHFSMMRNEVIPAMSERNDGFDIGENRSQRHTLGLRDVAYIIHADIYLPSGSTEDTPAKYHRQFRERVQKGQCWQRPYLGCREFAANFAAPDETEAAINITAELGLMLFDVFYRKNTAAPKPNQNRIEYYTHSQDGKQIEKGYAEAVFERFRLENGVLQVPPSLYERRQSQ